MWLAATRAGGAASSLAMWLAATRSGGFASSPAMWLAATRPDGAASSLAGVVTLCAAGAPPATALAPLARRGQLRALVGPPRAWGA